MTVREKILSLVSSANSVTGQNDSDLTTAIQSLSDGFGSGNDIVKTVLVDSLVEEINIYTVLNTVSPYILHYRDSIISIIILSNTAAVGGSAYTNNRFFICHDNRHSKGRYVNQYGGRVAPSSMLSDYNYRGTCYEIPISIASDGKLLLRSATDAITIPVGAKIMVYEEPLDDALWGE